MTHIAPEQPSEPYEPHPNNLIRDPRRMRNQYGTYACARGMSFNGSQTPLKPRNILIQSSIPSIFAAVFVACAIWFLTTGPAR